jgi:Spy/CpxP family protein refolding chaperone
MLRSTSLVGALALALLVSAASAQDEPRARGPGRRGGFGGGGMFNSPAALLGITEVRKELNVSEKQGKQLDKTLEQLRETAMQGFGNPQEFQDLSDEERQKRFEDMRKKGEKANKAAEQKISKILTAEQRTRLDQLALHPQGAGALSRPEVAKQLGLSTEQQDKLREIQEAGRPAAGAPGGPGGFGGFQNLSEEERAKRMTEMRERGEKMQADMLAVLTDDQKAKFAELKGDEFTFPPPQFGRFGGGGGNGGERRRPPTKQPEE